MPHIFISYAKKDTHSIALALNQALNAVTGVTSWVDQSLRAGKNWELQVQREIDRCDYVIVLYSPDINRHKQGEEESYVLTEIAYAKYTAKKPIIPIMAQSTQPPISMTSVHYIDHTLPGLTLYDLVAAICSEIGINFGSLANRTMQSQVEIIAPPSLTTQAKGNKLAIDVSALPTILPPPFEWCNIPGGLVTVEYSASNHETFSVPSFSIGKYPITNAQYRVFLESDDGFWNPKWWDYSTEASDWRKNNPQPAYPEFAGEISPCTNVCWYEAIAFTYWLSKKVNLTITLPTEQQWQRTAQGNDERIYPWGNNFDIEKCNIYESKIGQTTPVINYPLGASPYGAIDMAGNIWEFCLNKYDLNQDNSVLMSPTQQDLRNSTDQILLLLKQNIGVAVLEAYKEKMGLALYLHIIRVLLHNVNPAYDVTGLVDDKSLIEKLDFNHWLSLILERWDLFEVILKTIKKRQIVDLRTFRNRWAHHEALTLHDVISLLSTGSELMSCFGNKEVASQLITMRGSLFNINFEQNSQTLLLTGNESRIIKGGSWSDVHMLARCMSRMQWQPNKGFNNLGFRICAALTS